MAAAGGAVPAGRAAPSSKKILFLTNAEHGQANVFLATSHALLQRDADVEIHFASFAPIRKAVEATSAHALQVLGRTPSPFGGAGEGRAAGGTQRAENGEKRRGGDQGAEGQSGQEEGPGLARRPIVFHEIRATDYMTALVRPEHRLRLNFWFPPGPLTTPFVLWTMLRVSQPWSAAEFVAVYRETCRIIDLVDPHVVAVDSIFSPALTACRHKGIHFVVLSPNTIKDFAVPLQPRGAALWKYPIIGSSLPFPVPWYLIPLNVYYVLCIVLFAIFDFRTVAIRRGVQRATGGPMLTIREINLEPPVRFKLLVTTRPELDYPMDVMPPHIVPCGPILRPAPPVEEVDRELAVWLARGPTVLINQGTHAETGERGALQMAGALRMLFEAAETALPAGEKANPDLSRLQVLWKINKYLEFDVDRPGCRVYDEFLGRWIREGRVRMVNWITAEPHAILLSGHIVCSVNHGGANSFFEALGAGVPQVVLPGWADCYDFAHRAEMLGVGRWGSRRARPRWAAAELGPILVDVILGPSAAVIRRRTKEIARLTAEQGEGRDVAAEILLAEV